MTPKTIKKSFKATGIDPWKPHRIVNRMEKRKDKKPSQIGEAPEASNQSLQRLLKAAVGDKTNPAAKKLSELLHQVTTENDLLRHEADGLREAVLHEWNHKTPSKSLSLSERDANSGTHTVWTPTMVQEHREDKEREKQEAADLELE